MALVLIPTTYRQFTRKESQLECTGETVGQVMHEFVRVYPEMKQRIFDESGKIRSSVHVFVRKQDIRTLQGLDTAVCTDTEIRLIPAIAGG